MRFHLLFLVVMLPMLGFALNEQAKNGKKQKSDREVFLSAWPNMKNDVGLSVSADFLYWQASQAGMAYVEVHNFSSTPQFVGSYENIDFEFSPGVRTCLGIKPHYDFWQINVIWTYLDSKASGSIQLPVGGPMVVRPAWNVPVVGTNGTGAKATWWAHYNTLDLDISRELTASRYFGIKAHLGIRNLWLHEKYYILTTNNSGGFVGSTYNSNGIFRERIWGVGPLVGMDFSYNVGYGLSLFGKAMFSLLWSNVNASSTGTYLLSPPITSDRLSILFHTTLPEIGLLIGGAYNVSFDEDQYHIGVRLGWELQTLFNANYLSADSNVALAEQARNGNFKLSGLTAGFDFDF